MITLEWMRDLTRRLDGRPVLSIYIQGGETDPAERSGWRARLEAELDALEAAHANDSGLVAARGRVERELQGFRGFLPAAGWAAYATADTLGFCGAVPAPMPDLVRWAERPVFGPVLRALRQARPVSIVVLDQRRARLLEYGAGTLTETIDVRADEFIDDLTDRNMSKRAAVHSGVRGRTATDAADDLLRRAAEGLIVYVVEQLEASGADAVVIGGPAESAAALRRRLDALPGVRVHVDPSLHVLMSGPEIEAIAAQAASLLSGRADLALVEDVLGRAGAGGHGALGRIPCRVAASLGQVQRLLITPAFAVSGAEDAEELIRLALASGADLDLVSGAAAYLLDERAEGVGARLRYVRRAAAVPPAG